MGFSDPGRSLARASGAACHLQPGRRGRPEPALTIAAPADYTGSVARSGSGLCRGATRQEYGGNVTEGHAGAVGDGTPPCPFPFGSVRCLRKPWGWRDRRARRGQSPRARQATARCRSLGWRGHWPAVAQGARPGGRLAMLADSRKQGGREFRIAARNARIPLLE